MDKIFTIEATAILKKVVPIKAETYEEALEILDNLREDNYIQFDECYDLVEVKTKQVENAKENKTAWNICENGAWELQL